MKKASILAWALLLAACGDDGSSSTEVTLEPKGSLGSVLLGVLEGYDVPALGAYAFDSEGETGSGAVGLRRSGAEAQVELDDRWHLGSNTKAMTAALVARLETLGTISFDTTLAEVFPGVDVDAGYADVTLEDLLMHRGGAPEHGSALYESVRNTGTPSEQRMALAIQVLEAAPSVPSRDYAYSNVGYIIVGAAVEQATEESWESLMQAHLFEPLGMDSCGFGPPDVEADLSEPWGHVGPEPVAPGPDGDNPVVVGPAGTVHCSLGDWGKFAIDQLRGARGESGLLPNEAYARMHTPPPGGEYALGWGALDLPDGVLLTHTGSNASFTCIVFVIPDGDRGLLLVANRGDDQETLDALDAAAVAVGAALTMP